MSSKYDGTLRNMLKELHNYTEESLRVIAMLHTLITSYPDCLTQVQRQQIAELAFELGGAHGRVLALIKSMQPKEEVSE